MNIYDKVRWRCLKHEGEGTSGTGVPDCVKCHEAGEKKSKVQELEFTKEHKVLKILSEAGNIHVDPVALCECTQKILALFEEARPAEPEKQPIHHAFEPPEYRCQRCGSADELAHFWTCHTHKATGNGELGCPMCVQEEEDTVQ